MSARKRSVIDASSTKHYARLRKEQRRKISQSGSVPRERR
jgi:hypothetical protein